MSALVQVSTSGGMSTQVQVYTHTSFIVTLYNDDKNTENKLTHSFSSTNA